jgi:hypothetical protein
MEWLWRYREHLMAEGNSSTAGGAVSPGRAGRLHGMAAAVRGLRRPGGWPAAAAAVTAVVVVAGPLLAGCGAGLNTSTQREAISRALVAADGRQIVVPVTAGGCVQRSALTATATAPRVTLVLTQFLAGSVCPADLLVGTASVVLRSPLGGRSLVDGTTGRRIPYFDGRKLLRVTYLPPGYRFSGYFPAVSASWDREFTSAGGRDALLEVDQVPGNAAAWPSWPTESQARVHGRPATVRVGGQGGQVFGRLISWTANGYTFVVSTMMMEAGQHPLPVAELMKIAAGLQP